MDITMVITKIIKLCMARKKNLSQSDLESVSAWEEHAQRNQQTNTIRINEIPIQVKCLNKKQKELKKAIEDKEITISVGPAGTGKTFMSLITALHLLKTNAIYKKIVLIKSVTVIKGEELGFLPGTLQEKMEPYMWSFIGNLNKIFGDRYTSKNLMDAGVISIEPIAYVRGNTMDNSIVIIDEIQNLSVHSFRTIISRIGKNSKMIFLGDGDQIDLRSPKDSCVGKIIPLFDKETNFSKVINFDNEETVRNPIIKDILKLMENI